MKVITHGHTYYLENFEQPNEKGQVLQFIHKEPDENDKTRLVTLRDGTTNEEVIRVLIDRLKYLNNLFPCRENYAAIKFLQIALESLEEITRNREKRKAEGKNLE
jgi:hypothetical protein